MNTNDRTYNVAMPQEVIDGRRARGDETRRIVLAHAVDLASVEGLDGLSIGQLAEASGQSKSGVATLFGSKQALQLAVVEAAQAVFTREVVESVRARIPRGLDRVVALVTGWIEYSRGRVFAGGCFFSAASAEFDSKPGPVRDAVMAALDSWESYLAASLAHAAPELPGMTDPAQIAFEATAVLATANTRSLLHDSDAPYARAAAAIRDRLLSLGGDEAKLAPLTAVAVGSATP